MAPGLHLRLPHPGGRSTAQQELAFTLKNGLTYVERAIVERGIDVDDFAPRLSFFFNAHIDFFEEVAKYRAARRIWARELRDTYGARSERSLLLRFHSQTAGVSLTAQQPLVNVVRTALSLSAVLGGTQSLHTNSYDEALALPTEDAVRLALRTQQVIAHETGVANTIDPLGGSYLVEALTDRMEEAAYDYFRKIDELGGMVRGQGQLPSGDRGRLVPPPARGGLGRTRGGGGEPVPARGRGADPDAAHRPGVRAQADRASPGGPGPA